MIRGKKMNDDLTEFIDEGGELVITKQNGGMVIIAQTILDGQRFVKGVLFSSMKDLASKFEEIVRESLLGIRRLKQVDKKGHTKTASLG